MGTVVVWFLALGLALHIFETTMEIGATQENWGKKKAIVMGVLYAGVQLLLMALVRTGLEAVIIGICLYYGNGGALWGGICVLGLSVPGAVGGFLYGYWLGVKQKKVVCLTDAVFMTLAALGIFM